MPSAQDRLENMAAASLAAAFAEQVRYLPLAASANGRPGPDPTRPVRAALMGALTRASRPDPVRLDVPRTDDRTRALRYGDSPSLYVMRSALGYEPRQGDAVEAPAGEGWIVYSVTGVDRDGPDRLILRLSIVS